MKAPPRALVVEQDASAGEEIERFSIGECHEVGVELCDAVRVVGLERSRFVDHLLVDAAEDLPTRGLVVTRVGLVAANRFEHPQRPERGDLAGHDGLTPAVCGDGLRGEVVDLVGLVLPDHIRK